MYRYNTIQYNTIQWLQLHKTCLKTEQLSYHVILLLVHISIIAYNNFLPRYAYAININNSIRRFHCLVFVYHKSVMSIRELMSCNKLLQHSIGYIRINIVFNRH